MGPASGCGARCGCERVARAVSFTVVMYECTTRRGFWQMVDTRGVATMKLTHSVFFAGINTIFASKYLLEFFAGLSFDVNGGVHENSGSCRH